MTNATNPDPCDQLRSIAGELGNAVATGNKIVRKMAKQLKGEETVARKMGNILEASRELAMKNGKDQDNASNDAASKAVATRHRSRR